MSRAASKIPVNPDQLELIPKQTRNLFWHSTLFNEVYLENDVPLFHKDVWVEDEVAFETFLNQFRNFVESLDGEKPNAWSERTTINRFIKPVLEMLGYISKSNSKVEPYLEDEPFSFHEVDGLKTYKPDFIIVDDHKELKYIQEKKGQEKLEEARSSVFLTIEAKYWDRIEEYRQNKKEDAKRADKRDNGESTRSMDFDEQCLKYMQMLNKQYGILTDGKTWRLYNLSVSTPNYRPYFQFNLGNMVKHVQNSDFLKSKADYELFTKEIKYFYFLFRKEALFNRDGKELFVDELLSYSKKYVSRVEEDLKSRFVKAMKVACNGYSRASKVNGEKVEIETIRNVSESHIFNILFLKYCEARNILPIKQDPEGYRSISISNMLDRLEGFDPEKEKDNLNLPLLGRRFSDISYKPEGTQLYDRILKLTKIVQDGSSDEFKGFSIKGFKESIFSKDEAKFVQKNKLNNTEIIRILFELGYSKSDIQGRKYQQIPYNSFSPRQLGSIYESFLEYKIEVAQEDVAYIKKQWVPANLKDSRYSDDDIPTAKKGELFFTPNNKERKATGTYYTPDWVVQYIVRETLDPICSSVNSKKLLEVKVCDPAMGSGHFLSECLRYLATKYMEKIELESNNSESISYGAAKELVLHNCIYGVDINSRAVKLAKMSLWLETANANLQLEDLEDQLKAGNSLSDEFSWKKSFNTVFPSENRGGFDAVVANPPYVGEKDNAKIFNDLKDSNVYKYHFGKMDYWYFFVHQSVRILRPSGRFGFIATDYWMSNAGAEKLRSFLKDYQLSKYVSFKEFKVFKEAKGQHNMLLFLENSENETSSCESLVLKDSKKVSEEKIMQFENWNNLFEKSTLNYTDNFSIGGSNKATATLIKSMKSSKLFLDDIAELSQGFTPNPDKVNTRNIKRLSQAEIKKHDIKVKDGVFVVTKKELKNLQLTKEESKLAKPYIEANELINGEEAKFSGEKYLLYTTSETCNSLSNYKNIESHLKKFKPIMDERRETQQGRRAWFQLHWPKDQSFFEQEGIVSVRMTSEPVFVWNSGGNYFDLATNIIRAKDKRYNRALFHYLSSTLVADWLKSEGKIKGSQLQVDGEPLEKIPVPDFSKFKGNVNSREAVLDFCFEYFGVKRSMKKAA